HGSRTSSSLAWLEAVRPRIAIISAGARNTYGHPHRATLARLDSARIPRVWRTDREGTLCLTVSESGGWRVVFPDRGGAGGRLSARGDGGS
ncbi:MAG: ComEC/Rec2 family competence protein, partial [Gemmatimonadota bacterium]